jgi:FkbM family methyltransferase
MEPFCLKEIYSRLGDEESRFLFEKRLCYSLTGDMQRMICAINKECIAYKKLSEINKDVFIFGAGAFGHIAFMSDPKISWKAFIDNDKSKVGKSDILPIISFEEFIANSKNAVVFIPSRQRFRHEMKQQLISDGFPEEFIIDLNSNQYSAQYFNLPYFIPQKNEFFIDAGCFNGYTTTCFFQWLLNNASCNQKSFGRSIAFELNPINYDVCKNKLASYNNVKVVNKGLWHKEEILKFCNAKAGSKITSDGEGIIGTVSLDEYLKDEKEPVTFIKMDIEGAELNALKGAERIIKEQKPKLAISIYHKPEDVWEIPNLLIDFVPDYKFYIRHYDFNDFETILYGLPG